MAVMDRTTSRRIERLGVAVLVTAGARHGTALAQRTGDDVAQNVMQLNAGCGQSDNLRERNSLRIPLDMVLDVRSEPSRFSDTIGGDVQLRRYGVAELQVERPRRRKGAPLFGLACRVELSYYARIGLQRSFAERRSAGFRFERNVVDDRIGSHDENVYSVSARYRLIP